MRRSLSIVWIGLLALACNKRRDHEPPAAPSTSASVAPVLSASTFAKEPPKPEPVTIDVAIGGDAIPQVKVLANEVKDIFAGVPSCWNAADARVLNLEAPIGERKGLPGDKTILAFAAPPKWFADLYAESRASGFVVANNHACDLGPDGLAQTVQEAGKLSAPIAGAHASDPWSRIDVVEKGGRHVCVVAWTTFLNDKGRKQKGCLEGASGARVARAELGKAGLDMVHAQLGAPGRWDGCDARIAYLHGGREYKPQIRPVIEQATAAAAYVDAVIVSHPHVPDVAETVIAPSPRAPEQAGGRAVGRAVPLYRSLGNFVTNQGIAWTLGMSVELLEVNGVPDPIRTVWTRVAMLARLRFGWEPSAAKGAAPSTVRYGYSLVFLDRQAPVAIRMRPLPNGADDPVAAKLKKGPRPFSDLLTSPCRLDPDAPPTCDGSTAKGGNLPPAEGDPGAIAEAPHPDP